MNYTEAIVAGRKLVKQLACVVCARIVDADDLEVRVLLLQQRSNSVENIQSFVVARNNEGNASYLVTSWWIVDSSAFFLFAIKVVIKRRDHPQVRHEQRIVESEVEQRAGNVAKRHGAAFTILSDSESPCRNSNKSGYPDTKSSG